MSYYINTLHFKVQFLPLTNHWLWLCLNELLICCLLIGSKVIVKFRYWVGLGIMAMQNMCFISSKYVNNRHANKQLVNTENRPILKCYLFSYAAKNSDWSSRNHPYFEQCECTGQNLFSKWDFSMKIFVLFIAKLLFCFYVFTICSH